MHSSTSMNNECIMHLQPNASYAFDPTLGQLELANVAQVSLYGVGATVMVADRRRLQVPHTATRTVKAGVNDFPVQTPTMSNTNSAQQSYTTACVAACPLDTLTFTTCDTGYTQVGDTYFRLFVGNEEVTSNDDTCGFTSEIEYGVPSGGECQDYCLHIGCYANTECSAYVVVTREQFSNTTVSEDFTTRFIHYDDPLAGTTPRLLLTGLSLAGFSADKGGAVKIAGSVDLDVRNCQFLNTQATSGGAVYVTNSTGTALFRDSTFQGCNAQQGGAILIDTAAYGVQVIGSTFSSCQATYKGGAIFYNEGNNGAYIADSTFADCNADQGGAIMLGTKNNAFLMESSTFTRCAAFTGGGGLYMGAANEHGTVQNSRFVSCNARQSGGAIALGSQNHDFRLLTTVIRDSQAELTLVSVVGGGGLISKDNNGNLLIQDSAFVNCEAKGYGGGVLLQSASDNARVLNTTFTACKAKYGGALALYSMNTNVNVTASDFVSCQASISGGAVFMWQSNDDYSHSGGSLRLCVGGQYGGGVHMYQSNHRAAFADVLISYCASWSGRGGAMALSTGNQNVTLARVNALRTSATLGAGFYFGIGNNYLTLSDVSVRDVTATQDGGGLYFSRANKDVTLRRVLLSECDAILNGGGIYADALNDNMQLTDSVISECHAVQGGGIYSSDNSGLTLLDTTIRDCVATSDGGALNLYGENTDVTVQNCAFLRNNASNGGAIYSSSQSAKVVLVGSTVRGNRASSSGGGVYVESGNDGLVVMDAQSYVHRLTLESEHPYSLGSEGFTRSASLGQNASTYTGYYVSFDSQTDVSQEDTVTITTYGPGYEAGYIAFDGSADGWPGIDVPPLYIPGRELKLTWDAAEDVFAVKGATSDPVWGIRLYAVPVFETIAEPTVFSQNEAEDSGGAVYMFSSIQYPIIVGANFTSNQAGQGGALFLRNAIVGLVAHQLGFYGNTATDGSGGAVSIQSASYGVQFSRCHFELNAASDNGGALALMSNNGGDAQIEITDQNVVLNSVFNNNRATDGGCIFLDGNNFLNVSSCNITSSSAEEYGGGLMVNQQNVLYVEESLVSANTAESCGGGISAGEQNTVVLDAVTVKGNTASTYGGGLCLKASTVTMIKGKSRIAYNSATTGGGGIAGIGSYMPIFVDAAIEYNSARRGPGLYLNGIVQSGSTVTVAGAQYVGNTGEVGTIFWVNGSMTEPAGLNSASVLFTDNDVQYGNRSATQPVLLQVPSTLTVDEYGTSIYPPIEVAMQDAYGQSVVTESPAYIQIGILGASADSCNGRYPFLSGSDVSSDGLVLANGAAEFASVEAACSPGGSITLLYTAHLLDQPDLSDDQQTLYATTTLYFRPCVEGEYIVNGKCVTCPYGSYSLTGNVTDDTTCIECQSLGSVESCEGADLVLKEGYWRRYPTSYAIISCLDELSGCAGGNATGDASCFAGYEGPLCSVCAQGYYRSEKKCIPCVESDHLSPAAIFFITIGACAGVMGVLYLVHKFHRAEIGSAGIVLGLIFSAGGWFAKEVRDLKVQLKILITTFQICSTIPVAMTVTFPPQFASYLSAMSVFNLNVLSVVPVNCAHAGRYNFIDKMVMLTLAPIGLSLVLLLACFVEYARHTVSYVTSSKASAGAVELEVQQIKRNKVVSRYLTMFFFLTYLVLPFVSTTIFRTFLCTNVDPDDEDNDANDRFLTADMRISCDSDYYQRGITYAAVMIVVYVIGIPSMYFFLLYRSRHEIAGRFDSPGKPRSLTVSDEAEQKEGDLSAQSGSKKGDPEMKGALSGSTAVAVTARPSEEPVNQLKLRTDVSARHALMVSFLYEAYEPQFWYWEVVETTRRLMLTAVLSVCGTGTSGQALLALLLALMYIKLYGHYAPYLKRNDDIVAETGQFQIFLSFLGALVYQRKLLGEQWNTAVGLFLIFINTAVFCLFVYFVSTTLHRHLRDAQLHRSSKYTKTAGACADVEHGSDLVQPVAVVAMAGPGMGSGSGRTVDLRKVYIANNEDGGGAATGGGDDAGAGGAPAERSNSIRDGSDQDSSIPVYEAAA
jgi:predicted outer membrane repeat protein